MRFSSQSQNFQILAEPQNDESDQFFICPVEAKSVVSNRKVLKTFETQINNRDRGKVSYYKKKCNNISLTLYINCNL